MNKFSDFFRIKIKIFSNEGGVGQLFFESLRQFKDVMILEMRYGHVSLITDLNKAFKTFQCTTCEKCFERKYKLNRHQNTCKKKKLLMRYSSEVDFP